jgi:hypothetical protein
MRFECLPLATPYDSAEDPPGSVDPLGTAAGAEPLADVLFAGMTARMWRARHLTFAALAAWVAEQAANRSDGNEEFRLDARLALERLFVSAIARQDRQDDKWGRASRRLPGISLARRALASGDQPLGKYTFLKGQAINGPFGVVARLARHLKIVDDEDRLARAGQELLLAWSADQELAGLLDEANSKRPGAAWIRRYADEVVAYARDGRWRSANWPGWTDLAERLRPDVLRGGERKVIYRLLTDETSAERRRCLEVLERKETIADYNELIGSSDRGHVDRQILVHHLGTLVESSEDEVDRRIHYAVGLIDAYEQVAGYLQSVMQGLLWGLTHRGGRATQTELLADPILASHLARARTSLHTAGNRLEKQLEGWEHQPQLHDVVGLDRLKELLSDAQSGLAGESQLVENVLARHERIQRQKKKGFWIERDGPQLTLIPGYGDNSEAPSAYDGAYLHPFRVTNAYSLLADLKRISKVEVPDGEEK